jgi:hypothetical protein
MAQFRSIQGSAEARRGGGQAESAPTGVASATTGVCGKTAIRLRPRNSLHRPFARSPTARSHIFPAEQSANSFPTARRGPLPSRLHSAEAKVRRDLADLAARFEEVNAETILEIRALGNEITHMHMIDAAIATERRDVVPQLNRFTWVEMRIDLPLLGATNCLVPKFLKRKSILANWASSVFSRLPASAASATLVGASLRIRSPSAIRLIVKRGG